MSAGALIDRPAQNSQGCRLIPRPANGAQLRICSRGSTRYGRQPVWLWGSTEHPGCGGSSPATETQLTDREVMVGLRGRFGDFETGRIRTPYRYLGGVKYDPFVATALEQRGGVVEPLRGSERTSRTPARSTTSRSGRRSRRRSRRSRRSSDFSRPRCGGSRRTKSAARKLAICFPTSRNASIKWR